MIIAGFLFTLLIVLIICRIISREPYLAKEKPVWKKLVYWAGILFVSITFNILLYANNNYSFKLFIDINNEGIYILLWLILCYFIIQLLSPSMFLGRLLRGISSKIRKDESSKLVPGDGARNRTLPAAENTAAYNEGIREWSLGEKDFELFLNTVCWLSFSFVIFINLIPIAAGSYMQGQFLQYGDIQDQLNYVSRIMVFFTLPTALRQILFYLSKLKKSSGRIKDTSKRDSLRYERYMLVQKHLKGTNKRL
ncbi:MAG: hypothetical protein Q8930_08120 [Bacillota bacterium]|nr:hypothetical protein [Bacillota bacterium]